MAMSSDNVRAQLVEALRLDLVGPGNNHPFAHELLPESPTVSEQGLPRVTRIE